MIIDFHTHTFPPSLAGRALEKLAKSARARNYLDGTANALSRSAEEAGIDYSVLLPVVTKPEQQENINKAAIETNERSHETGLLSFGGIHPDNGDFRSVLRRLAESGVPGIKLHPVFQQACLNDIRYLRIIECACENDLIVLVHAGYDIGYPGNEYASVSHIVSMLDQIHPRKLVLAHMGGWGCWDEVEEFIAGRDVWLDTAFSLLPIRPAPGTRREPNENPPLSRGQFMRLVRRHGAHRILFGTDSPWEDQRETLAFLRSMTLPEDAAEKSRSSEDGLTTDELNDILGDNGARLLGLERISLHRKPS